MPIPDYQTVMLPLLEIAADGKEHHIRQAMQNLNPAARFALKILRSWWRGRGWRQGNVIGNVGFQGCALWDINVFSMLNQTNGAK